MRTKTKWMIGIVVVMSVIALSGVIYGVLSSRNEPAVAMGVCWDNGTGKVKSYELDGASICPEGEWPSKSVPLKVYTDTSNQPSNVRSDLAVSRAVKMINQRVGCTLAIATDECLPDVVVKVGQPQDSSWREAGGRTVHMKNKSGRMLALVETSNTGDDTTLHVVLVHEILHAFFVPHTDWDGAVMRRRQKSDVDFMSLADFWISDKTVAILRRYCPNR